jgi:protein-L-isoaspartate(D-aspartate) O-methyltransferase
MVERQLRGRGIADGRVLEAMAHVPRELFMPPEARDQAYRDGASGIGEGQTISQPWLVACMIALLDLRGRERVLEVGTGSGYSAAVLSRCCYEVVTIERHRSLATRATTVLSLLGYDNVVVLTGDGSRGDPERAPFDAIVVTAAAEAQPPPALFEQLRPGRPLVCPVRRRRGELLMRFRDGGEEAVVPVRFVPLVESGPDD